MSIGKLESLVISKLIQNTTFQTFISNDNVFDGVLPRGLNLDSTYAVVTYKAENEGPFDALTNYGILDIEVQAKHNNFAIINNILNLIKDIVTAEPFSDTGFFANCSYHSVRNMPVPKERAGVLAKSIRFKVGETY